ncbi:MAG: shikimate kinase [Oscillospiraceae bacterium]|nr:shikimate kinase [Oscillospiraceae bacterium]
MKNIVLIGMPGTGKSTVGVILAKRLGYDFLDTDILLARREGHTLPEILAAYGLEGFLQREEALGRELRRDSTVIATGGSMVLSAAAMENLCRDGVVVWLQTPVSVLEARLANHSREDRGVAAPADMTVGDIYAMREPYYQKYADLTIPCRDGADQVVAAVREALGKIDLREEK